MKKNEKWVQTPPKKSENKKKSGSVCVDEKSIAKCLRVGCEKMWKNKFQTHGKSNGEKINSKFFIHLYSTQIDDLVPYQ